MELKQLLKLSSEEFGWSLVHQLKQLVAKLVASWREERGIVGVLSGEQQPLLCLFLFLLGTCT